MTHLIDDNIVDTRRAELVKLDQLHRSLLGYLYGTEPAVFRAAYERVARRLLLFTP